MSDVALVNALIIFAYYNIAVQEHIEHRSPYIYSPARSNKTQQCMKRGPVVHI